MAQNPYPTLREMREEGYIAPPVGADYQERLDEYRAEAKRWLRWPLNEQLHQDPDAVREYVKRWDSIADRCGVARLTPLDPRPLSRENGGNYVGR